MSLRNLKLTISYDGTGYLGWQETAYGPSIESALRQVLEQILQHPVVLQATSRTDAGVHARKQAVNFFTSSLKTGIDRLQHSLNRLLPENIAVSEIEEKPDSFHPTLDCKQKEYRYYICLEPVQLPQHRLYSWHCYYPLQIETMRDALPVLLGKKNFKTFCNGKEKIEKVQDFTRELTDLEILELEGNRLCIRMKGNRFLYKMARNVAGTLVSIGRGKIKGEDLETILQSGDRTLAGVTAPAHGLFLHDVFF